MPPANLIIREATPDDSEAIIAYCIRLNDEPHNNVGRDPGQWTMTVEEEREYLLKRCGKPEHGIYLIAEIDGAIVGIANLDRGRLQTNNLSGGIGMSVNRDWRRRGIGAALLSRLIDWAKTHEMVRIELGVFARNEAAIKLYERFGFHVEGRHPYSFCKQGIWLEELSMGLILRQLH